MLTILIKSKKMFYVYTEKVINFIKYFRNMEKVKLDIIGMSYSQSQSGAYALILGVRGEKKRLPIIIGSNEAQAIAIELENMKPSRPLTHDLFANFARHYLINIKEVIINKFEEGIFYSVLVCEQNGHISEIDSRTSDAIALSLRFNCPVFAYKSIIDEAGIIIEDKPVGDDPEAENQSYEEPETYDAPLGKNFSEYKDNELQKLLNKAIEKENYEDASLIRDELNRRKKK